MVRLALNKLNLNMNKTKYIIFHFPQRNMALFNLELTLCGQHIECFRQFVFLGITIHETLNWDLDIDKIATEISRTLGVMNKLKHFLPKYTLKIMYTSLIAPHFNNNILLWGFNTHIVQSIYFKIRYDPQKIATESFSTVLYSAII